SCFARNFRHAFTCGAVYPVRDFMIAGAHFARNATSLNAIKVGAIETHMNGEDGAFVGVQVVDSGRGISVSHRRATVQGCQMSALTATGLTFQDDGLLDGVADANVTRGVRGIEVGVYPGTKKPSVVVSNHDHEGMSVAGEGFAEGFSVSAPFTRIRGGR